MVDLRPYAAAIDAARRELSKYGENVDAREGFRAELLAAGFTPPAIFDLSKIQRITGPGDTNPRKPSGWCILNEIPIHGNDARAIGIGVYGSWRGSPDRVVWTSKSSQVMTGLETAQYHASLEASKVQRENEMKLMHAEAAERAATMLRDAYPCIDHPYLAKKGVKTVAGLMQSNGDIIVPMYANDSIVSVQFIKPDGEKRFLTGGKVKGAYLCINGSDDLILICEGVATGISLFEATGATVYCAFSASNIYEVAAHAKNARQNAKIIIAGDDDKNNAVNAGRIKATQAAEGLGLCVAFPTGDGSDFNDMHQKSGVDSIKQMFNIDANNAYKKPAKTLEQTIKKPPGVLGQIVDYYKATAGNYEEGFAIQTALAIASIICARWYASNHETMTSMYFLNLAETGTGKEHIKKTIYKILSSCDRDYLISGNGYTSASAIVSALLDKPRHITVIDEMSDYIEAAKNKNSSGHLKQANSKLTEQWGMLNGVTLTHNFSTMGIAREKARELKNIRVMYAGITIMGMSTPDNFMRNMGSEDITGGFLNRFLIYVSDAEESKRIHKEPLSVPEIIIEWIQQIGHRYNNRIDDPTEKPEQIILNFSAEAMAAQDAYQDTLLAMSKALKLQRLNEMTRRSNEIAMRIALICALAENPQAEIIEKQHMEWGIYWVQNNLEKTVARMKMAISGSAHEADKKTVLSALREVGETGVTWSAMQKRPPFSKYKSKELDEILNALKVGDLVDSKPYVTGGKGRPTILWWATE